MAEAQRYPDRVIMRGDTWNGLRITSVLVNGSNPPWAAVSAVLEFFAPSAPLKAQHTVRHGQGVSVTNGATWATAVAAQKVPLPVGEWEWRLRHKASNGAEKTYLRGKLIIE